MKRLLLLLLLCGSLAGTALADGARTATAPVEASMLVTGTIVVAPDGSVSSYAVDHPEKLPSGVLQVIGNTVPQWKFRPILRDGQPVNAKAKMSLRIVARKMGGQNFAVNVRAASFGQDAPSERVTERKLVKPIYPREAVLSGVSGTVYVVLKVDRDGHVEAADVWQVDLNMIDSDAAMRRWRQMLAKASLNAARRWTFNPPTAGGQASDQHWVVGVPVNFKLRGLPDSRQVAYGQWQGYVPGPHELIPWLNQAQVAASGVDTIPAGGVLQLNSEFQLVSPLKRG